MYPRYSQSDIPSLYLGISQNKGYRFEGSHNKDYSILGSIFGSLSRLITLITHIVTLIIPIINLLTKSP